MIKNRYFKSTLGLFAEIVIAATLDTEETASGGSPATVAVLATLAANGTNAETLTITVDGVAYLYTVVGTPAAAVMHTDIVNLLSANAQGFVVASDSGTTSSIFNLSWGTGTEKNGKVVTLAETGTTFTVAGPYTFAGGVNADAAASDNYEDFCANSNAGTVWAFWNDISATGKQVALVPGDTKNPANIDRKFFYGWKDSAGNAKCTTAIPVRGLKYASLPYNAGQAQISKVTYGGTVANGQILYLRIQETTAGVIPFPSWSYDAVVAGGTADSAVAAIVAAINAETEAPIFTATAAATVATITGNDKTRTFKLSAYLEVTTAQPTDASAITFLYTTGGAQAAIAPIGDLATVQEIEKYRNIYSGGINYAPDGTSVDEFQTSNSNIGAITQFGILLVSSSKTEAGIVRDHSSVPYVVVVVTTGSEDDLAAL